MPAALTAGKSPPVATNCRICTANKRTWTGVTERVKQIFEYQDVISRGVYA